MPIRQAIVTIALVACAACGAREENGAATPDSEAPGTPAPPVTPPPATDSPDPTDTPPQRPAAREDTVMVEGMPQVERATLVTSPAGFALPFSTYLPEGMQSQFSAPLGVRFIAAFGGTVNEDAFMLVHVHADGAARPAARDILEQFMSDRSVREHETTQTQRAPWAVDVVGFRAIADDGTNVTGSVSTGEHGGRYFHVIRHYPVEYGDGLPPRLHTILRHWRWEDSGEMLVR